MVLPKKATKVTVGVIVHDGSEADPLRSWLSDSEVRNDPAITEEILLYEILLYLEEQSIASVVAVNRIIGCPHIRKVSITRMVKVAPNALSGKAGIDGRATAFIECALSSKSVDKFVTTR